MCDGLCKFCIDEREIPRTEFKIGRCEECYEHFLKSVKLRMRWDGDWKHAIEILKNDYEEAGKMLLIEKEEKITKDKKELSKNFKGWSFITLGPTPFFDFTDESKAKLVEWCNLWITETNYSVASWVIESGKNKTKPNLHLHFFCRIKNPRHHKRDLIHSWDKFFPNNKLVGNNYHIVKCNTEAMYIDKQEYMINNSKGTHENFIDLQLRGGFGGLGVITSQ